MPAMTATCDALPQTAIARPRIDAVTIAAVAITVVAWSSAFPAIRAGLTGFGPLELGAARFAIAAIPAAIFLAITRPALPQLAEIWRFISGGLLFVAFYTALLNIGEQTVTAGAASFIINVNPILTAALAMALLGERFGRWAWLGTALSFSGIGLIALGDLDTLQLDTGALFILGAAVCTAINIIVQKPLFTRHKPLTVSAWNMVTGALFLLPWLPNAITEAQAASTGLLLSVLYLGIVPSFIAYGSWTIALSRLPAARAANFMYCVPPTATLMGWLWLNEAPTTLGLIGGALALGGVVMVNLKR